MVKRPWHGMQVTPTLLQAVPLRIAALYPPLLEAAVRFGTALSIWERKWPLGEGPDALVKAARDTLFCDGVDGDLFRYTKRHSLEVAYLSHMMAHEAVRAGVPEANGLDLGLVFSGGFVHDIGKTLISPGLLLKEMGVAVGPLTVFKGVPMTPLERRVLRDEHIAAGTRFAMLFGGGPHVRVIRDMIGLHHVMYDGMDGMCPSYPPGVVGADLAFHARLAKAADFVSAVMPRHYRDDNWVGDLGDAVAYAVAVSGTELDPLAVRCLLAAMYGTGHGEAAGLVEKLGSKGRLSEPKQAKAAVAKVVGDEDYKSMTAGPPGEGVRESNARADALARGFGLPLLEEVRGAIKINTDHV